MAAAAKVGRDTPDDLPHTTTNALPLPRPAPGTLVAGRYRIQVVDLLRQPHLARRDEIVVIPTLVRKLPPPLRRIIGDLSNEERVLVGLDVLPRSASGA